MADSNYDVILVGGGVMGCATAYCLLKANETLKVALVEKDPTYARASTPLSDGNTRIQFNIKENIQMSQYGLEMLDGFAEEMAVGDDRPAIAFRRQGNLFLVDEHGRAAAEQGYELQGSLGCRIEWLTPEDLKQRYPFFALGSFVGGTFGRQDGTMDPQAVLIGYKNKAVSLGTKVIHAEVSELLKNNGRITGVRLSSGDTLAANHVVNAAGAWAPQIAETVGVNLPIEPTKRQVFVIEIGGRPDAALPLTIFPSGLYLIQEHGSVFLCGKSLPDDPIGVDDFAWNHQTFTEHIWPELVQVVPAADRLKVLRGWAGLYAVNTFDGNAILGEWPELKGLYLANGFSGHGFQQCHAVGRYISELILGRSPALDLSLFSPQRILDNKPVYESEHRIV